MRKDVEDTDTLLLTVNVPPVPQILFHRGMPG